MAIIELVKSDNYRMQILRAACSLDLPDWCIAAGFVRNLVWDISHQYKRLTHINDVDLVYFDKTNISRAKDCELEEQLKKLIDCNWSVKNQARMHLRNNDPPYRSTEHAISYWPEIETAIGVTIGLANENNCFNSNRIKLVTPFPLHSALSKSITLNPRMSRPQVFYRRIESKN